MNKNKQGQVFFYTMMIAVVFILSALAFAPAIKQFSDTARNASSETQVGLDCSNASISSFDKANCIVVDLYNPYFVGFLIFFAGAIIVARLVFSGGGSE